ncbi:MAG TPA: PilZ domain-containing protein [Nitrospiraceae bacterium]|nr:PilZ domain-containing protein [Nitrospiraceae bacterium]
MYRRISADCPGCYLTSSSLRPGVVRDISLNGFRIEGQSGLPRNTIVMVRLWLPNQPGSIDIDQAVVRWVNEHEFGVQIVALSNEADLRLAIHVEQALQQGGVSAVAC